MSHRSIVHADLDTFFVSVERLLDPSLRGRPVIVGGKPNARGVVAACSYETRAAGVHSGMPLRTAYRLCPKAIFLPGRFWIYRDHAQRVATLFRDAVPVVERASIDEYYFDISGCENLFGDFEAWCRGLASRVVEETGLPITLGIATNKLMAKIATNRAKKEMPTGDAGIRVGRIAPGTEAQVLAPLSIEALPGIGPSTAARLRQLGYDTLGDLQRANPDRLEQLFGDNGRSIHRRARGIDERPVTPYSEPKSIGHETTFSADVSDRAAVLRVLRRLAERTASDLRGQRKSATRVVLKWRYDNFETVTRSATIAPADEATILYQVVLPAAEKLFSHRAVRLVGIRAEGLVETSYQASLYEAAPEKRRTLLKAVDELRARYGQDIIEPGSLK